METQWLIIGISGVTCGGKTTLANEFIELLPDIKVIFQDDYFLPIDSDKHTYVPELNHFNWELFTSLDMEKMFNDVQTIIASGKLMNINIANVLHEFNLNDCQSIVLDDKTPISKEDLHIIQTQLAKHNIKILLIEGFSIFNYPPIDNLCHFKFYLTLSREICFMRRNSRTYNPPDVPGYFDKCVWPEHQRQLKEVIQRSKNVVFLPEENNHKTATLFDHLTYFFKMFLD